MASWEQSHYGVFRNTCASWQVKMTAVKKDYRLISSCLRLVFYVPLVHWGLFLFQHSYALWSYRKTQVPPLPGDPMGPDFRKLCLVVNEQRQMIYWSCLSCVMNHAYNVCQFKRYISSSIKSQFVVIKAKSHSVLCSRAQWVTSSHSTHVQHQHGHQLSSEYAIKKWKSR